MAIKQKTHRECANPDCDVVFRKYKSTDKYCCPACKIAIEGFPEQKPRQPIKPMSDKRKVEKAQYDLDRIVFLRKPENKFCVIKGPTCTVLATTVEHSMGREGYADEQKRYDGIGLYLDQDYWKPSCWNCNTELENNTELSHEHQLSKIHGGKKIK